MSIDFPQSITLEDLETNRPIYDEMKEVWERIDLLCSGGYKLQREAKKLLPMRFDEPAQVYKERLSKFSYLNIMGDAVRKQVSRISQGSINVSNIPAAEESFFEGFREDTNRKGRTEKQLVGMMFRECLKYKYIFLHVDQPPSEIEPQSLADREQMDRDGILPYINLYTPLDVRNWDGDADSSKLSWVKTRTVNSVAMSVFGKRLTQVKWTFITYGGTASYSALCELDENGNIRTLVDENGKPKPTTKLTLIPIDGEPVLYDLPYAPVVLLEVPEELWLADDAQIKAYEHLRLSCHHFDLLTVAFFQRFYKKPEKPPQLLPDEEEQGTPEFGQHWIPELENHAWSEPTGGFIQYIQTALDRIEQQVRASIALSTASIQPGAGTANLEQSGVSKEMDYVMSSELIEQYGGYLCDGLQDAYQLVLYYRGYPLGSAESEGLSVSGLDSFEVDSLDDMVVSLTQFLSIDLATLQRRTPPTLFDLIMKKLVGLLLGNLTAAQRADIEQELENLQLEEPEPKQPAVNGNGRTPTEVAA